MTKKIIFSILFFLLLFPFGPSPARGLSAEDVQLVTDARYFEVARKMIKEAKSSLRVMMFEMGYYEKYPNTPSNLLIKELIEAKKRGIKVEVILEIREGQDRASERNRHTGKILSDGGVEVIFDPLFKTMHAKSMVADGEWILIGSTNWVFSSLTNNNEVSVLIKSKEVAKALIDYFNQVKATGSKNSKFQAPISK
jgi:phosphatidylserine/phosphatidylglycerophosphate/cardiolipin synthase-like enzyme